jgi:hypothetical protein
VPIADVSAVERDHALKQWREIIRTRNSEVVGESGQIN